MLPANASAFETEQVNAAFAEVFDSNVLYPKFEISTNSIASTPGARARFEEWWRGATINSRRAVVSDIRSWNAFIIANQPPSPPQPSRQPDRQQPDQRQQIQHPPGPPQPDPKQSCERPLPLHVENQPQSDQPLADQPLPDQTALNWSQLNRPLFNARLLNALVVAQPPLDRPPLDQPPLVQHSSHGRLNPEHPDFEYSDIEHPNRANPDHVHQNRVHQNRMHSVRENPDSSGRYPEHGNAGHSSFAHQVFDHADRRHVETMVEQLKSYITALNNTGRQASTIGRHLASLAVIDAVLGFEPSPTKHHSVRQALKDVRKSQALARKLAQSQQGPKAAQLQKRSITIPLRIKGDVRDIYNDEPLPLSILGLLKTLPASPKGLRDRVILLLGAELGRHCSEYVAMNVGDIRTNTDGTGAIVIPSRSDTDRSSTLTTQPRAKPLTAMTMAAIMAWLELRADRAPAGWRATDEPLLTSIDRAGNIGARLTDDGLRHSLRQIARCGLRYHNSALTDLEIGAALTGISVHSFRVGLVVDMIASGADVDAICDLADWRSKTMPLRYLGQAQNTALAKNEP